MNGHLITPADISSTEGDRLPHLLLAGAKQQQDGEQVRTLNKPTLPSTPRPRDASACSIQPPFLLANNTGAYPFFVRRDFPLASTFSDFLQVDHPFLRRVRQSHPPLPLCALRK